MSKSFTIKLKPLLMSLLLSLGVGIVAGFLTKDSMSFYANLHKPPLSPPSVLFPIVWTILYFLMGISAYLIYISNSPNKNQALNIYIRQLIVNFFWSIIFFDLQMPFFAFIWLVLLILLVLSMIIRFYKIDPTAAYLQIPYLLWLIFAGYLNLALYLLN